MRSSLAFGLFLALMGCASQPGPSPEKDSTPETINYTPFQSVAGSGETPRGTPFHAFAVKVTFRDARTGESPLSTEQRPFVDRGSAIDELAPFRQKAEIYLVTSGAPKKTGALTVGGERVDLAAAEWVVTDRAHGLTTLAPFLKAGDVITVQTGATKLRFAVPRLFSPFFLARYETGAMMPTPMRGDTVIIDLDRREMTVMYRGTIPTTPDLRRGEFRLIFEPHEPSPDSTLEETRARFVEQQAYLERCGVPEEPVEPCSIPDHLPSRAFFQ